MKVITICGSMKFSNQMKQIAWDLETKQGYAVIQPVYNDNFSAESDQVIKNLGECHFRKIEISDAIYVVNINGYIGSSTQKEILFAKNMGKDVIYHENVWLTLTALLFKFT